MEGTLHRTHISHFYRLWVLLVDSRDGILDGVVGDVFLVYFRGGFLGLEGVVLVF